MAPAKALAQLALQKRLLQAESGARRFVLAADMSRLTRPMKWVDRVRHYAPLMLLNGAPVVAYLLTRRAKGMTRWVARGLGAVRVLGGLRHYLRRPAPDSKPLRLG